jgi:predicted phage terminase large subunit-like protein
MNLTRSEYHALLRTDFSAFIERSFSELNPDTAYIANWHIEVMAAALEDCRHGKTKRLIITVPPRSLKSHSVSVAFAAWLLGHKSSTQIICASYAQDLAEKHALDCRSLMSGSFYRQLFPATRLARSKNAVHDFTTTQKGNRLATSVGGVLTGRGADFIIIDDPIKPDEALSDARRASVNEWYDHTLSSRLNDKRNGCIILIMQRLHEDDLVGHVQKAGDWKILRFPAIAEEAETHTIETPYGTRTFHRAVGEPLDREREPLEILQQLRDIQGEYNFAGQYQQSPAPLGGGMVKGEWFRTYPSDTRPGDFEWVFQSWDTANKVTELSDYSVCTTWGVREKSLYLLDVLRQRLDYPALKRAVAAQAERYKPRTILVEDKASGTQLIQELENERLHAVQRYQPTMDKIMRMHSVTSTIENGRVYLPEKSAWLQPYLHELITFPRAKHDDQADSTSQALDWYKQGGNYCLGLVEYLKEEMERERTAGTRSYGLGSQSRYEVLARADSYNSGLRLGAHRPFRIYRP